MTRSPIRDALLCPSRRVFLAGSGAFVAWAAMPKHSFAGQGRDPRFLTIILRGAMDGLAVVPPVGDPDYPALRGDLAIGTGGYGKTLPLNSFFGLNEAMPRFHNLYQKGEALIVHAAATPYRDRSHFDGQDVLETGMTGPKASQTGWMNRLAAVMPKGDGVRPVTGLAATATVPLILRGDAPTLTWTPPDFRPAGADTVQRLLDLYAQQDPELGKILAAGIATDKLAGDGSNPVKRDNGVAASFRQVAAGSAKLLLQDEGPRIAVLSYDGWDTHANEGAETGRLSGLLAALDGAMTALADGLQPVWKDTVITVLTEFGRTAAINGNEGTDHGTATTAFLFGGAVRGGRVLADWPGLKPNQLYQNRDLAPTTDVRAILKGVIRDHLGVSDRTLTAQVFPDSIGVKPIDGLIT
ncbi:MAG: hypothetical protein JWN11_617 [Hyphomicrobiales bacterium]|nr:hypothetical protein [Hyphomicrobiales bacterium]